jgi:diadenosine tetraphosphate (Ap4A) HIT family hydrolase
LAFHDIGKQAPHHFLVIPKIHIASLNVADDAALIGKLSLTASQIAVEHRNLIDRCILRLNVLTARCDKCKITNR